MYNIFRNIYCDLNVYYIIYYFCFLYSIYMVLFIYKIIRDLCLIVGRRFIWVCVGLGFVIFFSFFYLSLFFGVGLCDLCYA